MKKFDKKLIDKNHYLFLFWSHDSSLRSVSKRQSDEPFFLRGESGANDSIIPTLDNLL